MDKDFLKEYFWIRVITIVTALLAIPFAVGIMYGIVQLLIWLGN